MTKIAGDFVSARASTLYKIASVGASVPSTAPPHSILSYITVFTPTKHPLGYRQPVHFLSVFHQKKRNQCFKKFLLTWKKLFSGMTPGSMKAVKHVLHR